MKGQNKAGEKLTAQGQKNGSKKRGCMKLKF